MSFEAMTWAVRQELPALQKLVLLMLANRTNPDTGRCDPSHDRLTRDCGMSKTAVKSALAALEAAGKLEIIRRVEEGVNLPNHYRLLMDAPPATQGVGRQTTHPSGGAAGASGVGRETPGGESGGDPGVGRETTTKHKAQTEKKKEEGAAPSSKPGDLSFDFEQGIFVGPVGDHFGRWSKAFPAIDVEAQVARAAAWLYANPANKKSNYIRFLTNWLNRAQDNAPRVGQASLFGAQDHDRNPPRRSARGASTHDDRNDWLSRATGRQAAHAGGEVIDV